MVAKAHERTDAEPTDMKPQSHRAECRSCGRTEVVGGDLESFERVLVEFASHVDDGSACHEFRIDARYSDGVERVI